MALRRSSVLTLAAGAVALLPQPGAIDYAAIFSDNEPALVFVSSVGHLFNGTTEEMNGSGFVVDDSGLVLTNDHVTFSVKSNYESIDITVHPRSRTAPGSPAILEWNDGTLDLALLRITPTPDLRSVVLGQPSTTKTGSRLAVMGFPLNSDLSIVDGLLSAKPMPTRWQTSAPLNLGNSGGPVFNSAGHVIGVVASGATSVMFGQTTIDVDGIGYFIPIDQFARESSLKSELGKIVDPAIFSDPVIAPPPPPSRPKTQRLARSYVLSQVKDDHPVLLLPSRKEYVVEFPAEPGYRIASARVERLSENFATGLETTVVGSGARVRVTFTLESGPALDRYRGWLYANIHTDQVRQSTTSR